MSREEASADISSTAASFLSPLCSPATIVTPKWRRVNANANLTNGPDGFALDSSAELEEEEDTSDDKFLERHDEYAMEERKRWLPVDPDTKSKSPSTKKRHKLRATLPIYPTPMECHEVVRKSMPGDQEDKMSRTGQAAANGSAEQKSASMTGAQSPANGRMSNGDASHQRNGHCNEQCLVITMESFKRLQDVLCREKDYFNRVLNGLEKCISENEPSIAIHTDVDRKVVFSQNDFNQLIQSVKYSFESIDSIQLLLREKSDGLKKEVSRHPKLDRAMAPRNAKSKHRVASSRSKSTTSRRSLIPTDYKLEGVKR